MVVAMSGGVDSSLAAALLVEAGFEAIGVMLRLWAEGGWDGEARNRCCSPGGVENARAVCAKLGMPFYLVNLEREFRRWVVEPWIESYALGRTPNPCLACNRHIKFGRLRREALALGARFLATGHYARVERREGDYLLLKGRDERKDQSYVLYTLGQEELSSVLFPVGEMTKEEVRARAKVLGLVESDWEESQDLCFLRDADYRRFLRAEMASAFQPGPILDAQGRRLGTHQGLPGYTIGQRQGLGIGSPWPLYVLALDGGRNALVVGRKEELLRRSFRVEEANFPSGEVPQGELRGRAKVRYRASEAAATLTPLGRDSFQVRFDTPQPAITPGQAAVFYQGEVVVAGGIIAESLD